MKHRKNELVRSDIFSHIPAMNYLPRWGVLLMDATLCTCAFWLSVWIGTGFFDYKALSADTWSWGYQYFLVMAVQVLMFWAFHTYSGILRYSTFIDTIKVLLANVSTVVLLLLMNLIWHLSTGHHPVLNTVLMIYMPVAFVLLFMLRVGVKTIMEALLNTGSPKVMIYGTKEAGVAIAKMLRSSGNAPYRPVGFISDAKHRSNYLLAGLRVRALNEKLFEWMESRGVKHVIVSPMKMQSINPAKDLQIFIDHNIRILTTPYFTQFDNVDDIDAQRIGRIDAIRIEDLLERPQIEINTENVQQVIQDKVAYWLNRRSKKLWQKKKLTFQPMR